MQHPNFPFAPAGELETIVKKAHRQEFSRAMIAIALTLGVFAFWIHRFSSSALWFSVLFFASMVVWLLFLSDETDGTLVEEAPEEWLGKYTVKQLHGLVRESCQEYGEKEIPNVYIMDTSEGAAFVMNVDIFNFVPQWNGIYLSRHLLSALEPDELKAIIGHEMCHFSLWYTFWTRYFYLRPFIFGIWVTTFLCYPFEWVWKWSGGGWWFWGTLFLLSMLGITRLIWFVALLLTGILASYINRPDSQEVEALCDYESAKRVGLLPMVNALLKIGTRSEIINAVLLRFSPDDTDPMGWSDTAKWEGSKEESAGVEESKSDEQKELEEEQREAAMGVAILHLLENLPMEFLSLEDAEPLIEEAVAAGLEAIETPTFKHEPRKITRWLQYDTHKIDQRLDAVEFEGFIAALKENPEQPLFNLPDEIDTSKAEEHPPLRNRILFLEYNGQTLFM